MTRKERKIWYCVDCGAEVPRKVKRCPDCHKDFLSNRPGYIRTEDHRQRMSEAQKGKKHDWASGSTRPEVAQKIRDWWTPERREERRLALLERKPDARYHGLSSRRAAEIVRQAGCCTQCDQTEGRLDIHHIDGDKRNQDPENLTVLCHRCHMKEHAKRGETGFDSMWRKRKTTQH
jgi:5-methylcytosine-specific restriction endonuclease McrA